MITFHDFSFQYAMAEKQALSHIDFHIPKNKITVLCGKSGCGKTTLLRLIKEQIAPVGQKSGTLDLSVSSQEVAIVFQNPETQLVCGTVLQDLVFQMENLGFSQKMMKKRLAETVSFFGIEALLERAPESLSGGQKQLVALCSAMMTYPRLLLLDEPLSQLDPIAQNDFLQTLSRIHEEFGVTILLSEHRLNDVVAFADYIGIMKQGQMAAYGKVRDVLKDVYEGEDSELTSLIPSMTKAALKLYQTVCLTPREVRDIAREISYTAQDDAKKGETAYTCQNLVYHYPDGEDYVLKRLKGEFYKGQISCLFGGNGSGKSTLLKILSGILTHYNGKIKREKGKIGYMPQDVHAYFLKDIVKEEIYFSGCDDVYYQELVTKLSLQDILLRHPYDISSGEAGRVVLASLLLKKPDTLLLDEPTKGLDAFSRSVVAKLLKQSGATVIMATHDLDFAAQFADWCYMLFDGDIAYSDTPHAFFCDNRYYTTAIHRAFSQACPFIISEQDVDNL